MKGEEEMRARSRVLLISLLVAVPLSASAQYIVRELDAPGPEVRGLAWDGSNLWCADVGMDSLFKIDPQSGDVIHSIHFNLNSSYGSGITWSGDEALWVTRTQYFYKLGANTGKELTNFHCPGG